MLSDQAPKVEELAADDVRQRLPRFQSSNVEKNQRLCSALEAIARSKNARLAQLSIAWPMAQGKRAGVYIVPIPGAKSASTLRRMRAPRTLCSRLRILRKSTVSSRPVPRPALTTRLDKCTE
jgi:aryl-alcohol dehydrogenase-like predicted oxidoreductase